MNQSPAIKATRMEDSPYGETIRQLQSRLGMDNAIAGLVFGIHRDEYQDVVSGKVVPTDAQRERIAAIEMLVEFMPCEDED